jgi:hypothetical protein
MRPFRRQHAAPPTPYASGERCRWRISGSGRPEVYFPRMERPVRFEDHRYLGDKRTQVVHDVDACNDESIIDELLKAETYICFGPDTLPEARNRGYRRCGCCVDAAAAKA